MELNFPQIEQKILKFWQENKIFEKLRKKNQGKKHWSFLDGPITANNPMGVHHAWGRTYKDVFQRYKAMRGFDQRYQNGFDCQGLWVEVEVEKELGFKTKKDIERYGITQFVEKCKERVRKFSAIQIQQSIRLGQWMDWKNSYYTMSDENNYAIWGFLKKCWQKDLLYKGRDSVPWCPRCGTAISQHEILTEEYKEITHKAVYFKLPIIGSPNFKNSYFLVWTTTPWTIPANVVLVFHPDFEYGLYEHDKEKLILLKDLAEKILPALRSSENGGGGKEFVLKKTFKGKKLKGLKYEGPFDNFPRVKNAEKENPKTFHTVVLDKGLVTAEEGTGIIHCAPGAGEEDFKIGQKEKLSVIEVIDESAVYLNGLGEFSGKNAKENPEIILEYLKQNQKGKFFYKIEDYTHRYPTCWRCKTELVWRVVDEWYIAMDKMRKPLMEVAKQIKWIPGFGLERELDWLKNMHDWLISKKRYWGLTLPIFECGCGNFEVIGSKEELKERAVEGWEEFAAPPKRGEPRPDNLSGWEGHSPHRPWVDKVKIKCSKCEKLISRILDVGNPWLDAGIVPFSTMGYYSDKKYWQKWFPADLVCESFPGQFKNWFYAIITMSTVLESIAPIKTIFGYALVHDEKGEEMHKSKGNAIEFNEAAEKIGADPMRWMYARQNPADNLNFGYNAAAEIKRKLLTLFNIFEFFNTYVGKKDIPKNWENLSVRQAQDNTEPVEALKPTNKLDAWILSRLNSLIEKATRDLDGYNPAGAVLAIENFFINDLSLWYLRRSRKRFHPSTGSGQADRKEAIETLYCLLINLLKIIAPVMPFLAENIYQVLKSENMPESIHLSDWPKADKKLINVELEKKMTETRNIVALALAGRAAAGIKVRQPLEKLKVKNPALKKEKELLDLIKEEVNVKKIIFDSKIKKEIELDTKITKELKEEGMVREVIRHIQEMRKKAGLTPADKISVWAFAEDDLINILSKNKKLILKGTKAENFNLGKKPEITIDIEKEIEIDKQKLWLGIRKIKN